ncbi:Hypothetical protein FKW44_013286, partial [Caligus rogercresseyi]
GKLPVTNPPPMAFGLCRTHSGCFGVTNPPPIGSGFRQHTGGVIWVTISRQWDLG